jgi:hypothetical protein
VSAKQRKKAVSWTWIGSGILIIEVHLLARLQEHFLKSFQFLYRPRNRWIFFAYVELSNFSSGAIAGISHRKAHSYEAVLLAVVFLLSRLNIEIRVSERRVGQSEAKRELGLDTLYFVAR